MKNMLLILLITSASGCASIINGTSQQISVRSNVPDTEIYANEQLIGTNSAITSFKKKKEYVLTARKSGCTDANVIAQKSFDPTSLLGILIDFGLVSMLIVDGAATGAWNQFDQTNYIIDPICYKNTT